MSRTISPDFALSLSSEGVRLLHRSEGAWQLLGEVSPTDPDMATGIAALRKRASALADGPLRSWLILPNDQIRYMTLDAGDASDADVHEAIDGATPYALDELAIDHISRGGKTYIAAVARETLDEAEAFAVDHDFGPLAFAASPDGSVFQGEAFFGATRAAASWLKPGETVARSAAPVREGPVTVNRPGQAGASHAAEAAPVLPNSDHRHHDTTPKTNATEKTAPRAPAAPNSTVNADTQAHKTQAHKPDEAPPQVHPASGDATNEPDEAPFIDVPDDDSFDEMTGPKPGATEDKSETGSETPSDTSPVFASRLKAQLDGQSRADSSEHLRDGGVSLPPGLTDALRRGREAEAEDAARKSGPSDGVLPASGNASDGPHKPTNSATEPASGPAFARRTSVLPGSPLLGKKTAAAGLMPGGGGHPAKPEIAARAPSATLPSGLPLPPGGIATPTSGPVPVPPRLPAGSPPPAVAERLAAIAGRGLTVPRDDFSAPVRIPLPSATRATPPPNAPDVAVARPDWLDDAAPAPIKGSRKIDAPPSDLAATLKQEARGNDLDMNGPTPAAIADDAKSGRGLGGLFSSRRKKTDSAEPGLSPAFARPASATTPIAGKPTGAKAAKTPVRSGAPTAATTAVAAPLAVESAGRSERETMTVFGARAREAEASRRTRPRYLLLILVTVLVLSMLAVAAVASGGGWIAAWLGLSEPTLTTAESGSDTAAVSLVVGALPAENAPVLIAATAAVPAPVAPADEAPSAPDAVATLLAPGQESAPGAPGPQTADARTIAAPPVQPNAAVPDPRPASQTDPDPPALAVTEPEPDVSDSVVAVAPAPAATPATNGAIPSPAEVDRFYAATGVWLRAPRLPLLPQSETLTVTTSAGSATPATRSVATALTAVAPDSVLAPQLNPPAANVSFPRDPRGFFLATADGIVTPDGMAIFAGAPALSPPTRPGTIAPVPEPEPVTEFETEATDGSVFINALEVLPGRPALRPASFADIFGTESIATTNLDPMTAPDERALTDVAPASAIAEGTLPDAASEETPAETPDPVVATLPGGVSLDGLRPPARPGGFAATLPVPEPAVEAFAGPRPPLRPASLDTTDAVAEALAGSEAETEALAQALAEAEAAAAPAPVTTVSSALAAIVAAGPDPLASATRLAVARAPRPDSRPRNFATVVDRTQSRQQAATAPAAAATPNAGGIPRAAEDDGEPEVASNAAATPTGPTSTTVAAAATQDSVINLRAINLIGVYGRPNDRRALIRLANGRYVRVGVGDSFEGGQITAIGDNALNYVVRGQLYALVIPSE